MTESMQIGHGNLSRFLPRYIGLSRGSGTLKRGLPERFRGLVLLRIAGCDHQHLLFKHEADTIGVPMWSESLPS